MSRSLQRRRVPFGRRQLILAPLLRRKSRALLSLSALALGASLVTALLTLYRGVQTNLSGEFRRYGANLVVTPPDGVTLLGIPPSQAAMAALAPLVAGVGVQFDIATVQPAGAAAPGREIVIAGARLPDLLRLNTAWRVDGPLPATGEAWLGVNAARLLGVAPGQAVTVNAGRGPQTWRVVGTVQSGGSEDSQLLAPLPQAAALSGLNGYTTLQLRAPGTPAAMAAAVASLQARLPGADVQPVRQIARGEGAVLLSTHNLLLCATLLILFTVGLCLAAALTTLALERRRDFGVMKALGASDLGVMLAFVGEAALLGLVASVAGALIGAILAGTMGKALFGLWLYPTVSGLALTALLTVGLATLAALLPWPIVQGATPAAILRGE